MASAATHRNGLTAMSCEIWLVVATRSVEPQAESASQKSTLPAVGRMADSISLLAASGAGRTDHNRHAVNPHTSANTRYNPDHIEPCVRSRSNGSKTNG